MNYREVEVYHESERVLGLILVTLVPICFPADSSASVYYSLTDTTTGAGYGTTYPLEVFSLGGSNYRAMLTADTTFNSGWYIDWFAIKFDGGTVGDITSPIDGPGPAGTWLEGTGAIDLQKYTDFPNNTWTGAYVE